MISRFRIRPFSRLLNIRWGTFLSHVNWEKDVLDTLPERSETTKLNENFSSDTLKIKPPSFHAPNSSFEFIFDKDGYVNVFTDGACHSNGTANSKAGIGVWFGDNHPLNVSRTISERPASNVAEIVAVIEAAKLAKEAGVKKLKINTDSQFLIKCVTKWMIKWKLEGWQTSKKKPVINRIELEKLDAILSDMDVTWVHVSSHSGIHGNEMAHKLAKKGIINSITSEESKNQIDDESYLID